MQATRREKAAATRRRMRAAAEDLFLERGYAATSIQAIAGRAGVAPQTIYFTFRTKIAVLKELVDVRVAGDDAPVSTLDRPWARQAVTADPAAQLELQVRAAREIGERVGPVLRVLRGAATADPEAAQLWATNRAQHHTVTHRLVQALADKGGLHPALDVARATDIVLAVAGTESFELLVFDRGWTAAQWEDWAHATVAAQLLAPGGGRTDADRPR